MCDEHDMLVERIQELEQENRLLRVTYGMCRDCLHADLYIPSFTYPFFDPKCRLHHKNIKPDDKGCEDFKLMGRQCR